MSESRQGNFAACGSAAYLYEATDGSGRLKLVGSCCHDRFCVPCGNIRSWRIRNALRARIENMKPIFLTLTLRAQRIPLRDILARLYKCWKTLRETELWNSSVRGGVCILEVKWNAEKGWWHPHLHILADARFIRQAELSQLWHGITGDSFRIDIRRVENTAHATRYITKYASKPMDTSVVRNHAALVESMLALRGKRLVQCFGDWYGTPLKEECDDETGEEMSSIESWTAIDTIANVFAAAEGGCVRSMELIWRLEHQYENRGDTS